MYHWTMSSRFTLDNPMPPPWLRYPQIPMGSIGWRMGTGEDYAHEFGRWLAALDTDERWRYRGWFPPPPMDRGYYDWAFGADYDEDFVLGNEHWSVQFWQRGGTPAYSRARLATAAEDSGACEAEFVFFWKPKAGETGPACLGQWQPTAFDAFDHYSCTEQYMMAEKARLFGDDDVFAQIMATGDPKTMKALGRKVRGFDAALWDRAKYSIVLNGNYYKFTQNPQLRDYLLSTTGKVLVEASPMDRVWGIGIGATNPDATNPERWRGHNLLGFALMEVRDAITRVYANADRVDWSQFPPLKESRLNRPAPHKKGATDAR